MSQSIIKNKSSALRLISNFLLFLIVFAILFFYQNILITENSLIFLILDSLILVVFLLSVFRIKWGFYLFIFLIPLINSLPKILNTEINDIILLVFFPFILGFYINYLNDHNKKELNLDKNVILIEDFKLPVILFISIFSISAFITIFRFSNFFPFFTHRYYNLFVNINNWTSTISIFWTLRFFFNYLAGFIIFFAAIKIIKKYEDIMQIFVLIILSFTTSAFILFYQIFANPYFGNSEMWVIAKRFNATFTDPNALGSYTIILFPILFSLFLFIKKWYFKVTFFLLIIVFFVVVYNSGSRSSFIAIFFSILLFFIFFIIRKVRNKKNKFNLKVKHILLIIIIFFIVFNVLITSCSIDFKKNNSKSFNNSLSNRIIASYQMASDVFKEGGITQAFKSISSGRNFLWPRAVSMFKDYPVSGVGLGAFIIELPNYYKKDRIGFVNLIDFTGNYYLQILSELGFIGLLLILYIFYLIFSKFLYYFRLKKQYNNKAHDWLIIGLFVSFFTMLFALFFGNHTNSMEIQLFFYLIIGLLIAFINISTSNNIVILEEPKNIKISHYKKNRLFNVLALLSIILTFTISFSVNSFKVFSINIRQNSVIDKKGNIYSWQNTYGFYDEEGYGEKSPRWTNIEASINLDKTGDILNIYLKAQNPDLDVKPLIVKIYIDYGLVKEVKLKDKNWYKIKIDLSNYKNKRFALTIMNSRTWVPKEWGTSEDSRELGVYTSNIGFDK